MATKEKCSRIAVLGFKEFLFCCFDICQWKIVGLKQESKE